MKSVGRGKDLMRTLTPTQIDAVNGDLIKLKSFFSTRNDTYKYIVRVKVSV